MPFEKLLIRGDHIGESYRYCYIGVFKSAEIEQDTWHMGNALMSDYYAVFDLTPADERNENFIQFGIGKKVAGHVFEYESGSVSNIEYDADGNEIYTPIKHDEDVPVEVNDDATEET